MICLTRHGESSSIWISAKLSLGKCGGILKLNPGKTFGRSSDVGRPGDARRNHRLPLAVGLGTAVCGGGPAGPAALGETPAGSRNHDRSSPWTPLLDASR